MQRVMAGSFGNGEDGVLGTPQTQLLDNISSKVMIRSENQLDDVKEAETLQQELNET